MDLTCTHHTQYGPTRMCTSHTQDYHTHFKPIKGCKIVLKRQKVSGEGGMMLVTISSPAPFTYALMPYSIENALLKISISKEIPLPKTAACILTDMLPCAVPPGPLLERQQMFIFSSRPHLSYRRIGAKNINYNC